MYNSVLERWGIAVVALCVLSCSCLVLADNVIGGSTAEEENDLSEPDPEYVIKNVNGSLRIYPRKEIINLIEKPPASPEPQAGEAGNEGGQTNEITASERAMRAAAVKHYKAGIEELNNNNFDRAVEYFNEAAGLASENAQIYRARGKAYAEKKDFALAIEDFTRALTIEPDHEPTLVLRARAWRKTGDYDQAIKDCNHALEINRYSAAAYFNRAAAYCYKGEFDPSLADYSNAIELEVNKASLGWAYYERATVYFNKADYGAALADLKQALMLDPEYAAAYALRAKIYAVQEKYDLAWEDVRHAEALRYTLDQDFVKSLQEIAPLR
ncbi:MAG: tetratricopeptide repeat protein [Candidatus Omnitrophota bacterium]